MKKRSKTTTIAKAKDKGKPKIIISKAVSTEDDIRFYLDDRTYVTATSYGDMFIRKDCYETEKDKAKKVSFSNSFSIAMITGIYFLVVILIEILIVAYTKNLIILSLLVASSLTISIVLYMGFLDYKRWTPSIRSKHSAEHMMVNFLEKNARLPKNFKEFKSASRFHKNCGSANRIRNLAMHAIVAIISIPFCNAIDLLIFYNLENVNETICNIVIIAVRLVVVPLNIELAEAGIYDLIIYPFQKLLSYILQCFNTTNKVKDEDILVAFYTAKFWLKNTYPEFYNDTDELYCKKDESDTV